MNGVRIVSSIRTATQLRSPQTRPVIGVDQSATVVVPMPVGIIKAFLDLFEK